jgi:hypothetical protein
MSWCKLTPLYKDEPDKYHLLTTSLFVKQKYIKTTKGIVKDMGTLRRQQFISTIKKHIEHYENGYWNDKYRLRIYFDSSFERNEELSTVFNEYKDHPFLQWIRYELPNLKDPEFSPDHIGMIGTIIRFHPFFVKNNKINCVSAIDMDNWYTEKWKDELTKFKKSNHDLHWFNPIINMQLYGIMVPGLTIFKNPKYWIPGCAFSSKITFPEWRWKQLPDFIHNHMIYYLRVIDLFKVALFDNRIDRMMEDYEYGIDEIYINYIVEYYISKNKVTFTTKEITSYNIISLFIKRILNYIKWNDSKTYRTQQLYHLLNINNYDEFEKKLLNIKSLSPLFDLFRHKHILDLMKTLQMDHRIIYTLEHLNIKNTYHLELMGDYINNT